MGWRQVAVQLEAHELVTAAMKRTGKDDFGPGNWSEPLEVLCTSLRREARLDLAGRRWARGHLLGLLTTRATHATRATRAARAARAAGAFADSGVGNDAIRSFSAPESSRVAAGEPIVAATPDLRDPWTPGAPDDDDDELALTLCSIRFEQWWHVPGYAEWLDGADLSDAYRQWGAGPRNGRGGLLHLEHIPELRAALPSARVEVHKGDLDAATDAMVAEVGGRRAEAHTAADVDQLRRYWRWRLGRMLDRTAEGTREGSTEDGAEGTADSE